MFRTRLTHSIEVSQIARSIARTLGGHEDLAETISLAHDLGHTPFGHAGQDALNKCMKKYGGFEHNLQSLRIVDNLEKRYVDFNGLNLMFESREGILKHCSLKNAKKLGPIGERFIRKQQPSIEAQIVNIADEIAYINHDIDDGFRSGLLSIEALMTNALFKLCADDVYSNFPKIDDAILINEVVRRMINWMVSDLISTSTEDIQKFNPTSLEEVRTMPSLVKFSSELFKSKQEIKSYLRKSLYEHKQVKDMTDNAQHIIKTLFDYFTEKPSRIPKDFKKDTTDAFERTVSDYIAGMTDRFAIQLYNKIR
jgi:dGTPase